MISPPLVDCIAEIAATERGEHTPGALMGAADWCVEASMICDPPTEYRRFLDAKVVRSVPSGFEPPTLNRHLFPFQQWIVERALRLGRSACFAGTGLGKTAMQLEWAHQVAKHTGQPVMVLAPLAVTKQTEREGRKFGIDAIAVRHQSEVMAEGVFVTNYDMIGAFDLSRFVGVVLDESSILKNYTGATKRKLQAGFDHCRFSFLCTATPSPNDHIELGNHAEFVKALRSSEMLSRWFLNDTMKAGGYRLKTHAAKDFWRWVSSWSVAIDRPSDIGFPDDGFNLPPLHIIEHIVHVDHGVDAGGMLFRSSDLSATSLHREMRLTAPDRAAHVADLVHGKPDVPWLVWCNTNYEAEELMKRLPARFVEVRGEETAAAKEEKLNAFSSGAVRGLVSKPSICGFGMNWQHCRDMAFVGLSYSFEALYQAIRRSWRYGQTESVNAHMVMADTEGPVLETIRRKQRQHEEMRTEMVNIMGEVAGWRPSRQAQPARALTVPEWMR